MLFTIIIPVYNGLSHGLPICLNSIWNQPLNGSVYEVICVDDCSTDQTRDWLQEQTKIHDNLRIILNKKNLRQGGSRNKGICAAQGKYIVFIDQDDYFHHDAIARIYEHLKESYLQILIVDSAWQDFGKESNKLQHNFPHKEVMTGDQIIACQSIPYAPWKFIVDRCYIIENNLFFIEYERLEDIDWVHKLVLAADYVQYQPILFIHYNKNASSTTMSYISSKDVVYSGVRLAHRLWQLKEEHTHSLCYGYLQGLVNGVYHSSLRALFFCYDKPSIKEALIKELVHPCRIKKDQSILLRMASTHPLFFSYLTNISVPFARLTIGGYRIIKQIIQ